MASPSFNRPTAPLRISVRQNEIHMPHVVEARDLWSHRELGRLEVRRHGVVMLRVRH